jgi:hypothetical protein
LVYIRLLRCFQSVFDKKKRAENVFLDEKTMDLVFPVITMAKFSGKKNRKPKLVC